MLHCNVGGIDRVLRLVLGAVLVVGGLLLLTGKTRTGMTIAVVGLLVLLTGVIRFCALYIPFGISTVRTKEAQMKPCCTCAPSMNESLSDSRSPSTEPSDAVTQAAIAAHGRHLSQR